MNEVQEISKNTFDYIKDYPELLLLLLDKYVEVKLIKNTSFCGFLHSIDPITFSVIISVPREGSYQTTVIPGHAVLDVQEKIPSPDVLPNIPPARRNATQFECNVEQKKKKLKAWFEKNLLPVTEVEGNLNIGNVSVLSPYNVTDICAENPVIALQIKKIIESMPPDFHDYKQNIQPTD